MPIWLRAAGRATRQAWAELVNRFSRYVYAIAVAGLPAPGARRGGRLPGRLHPHLGAPGRAARRHGAAALDRDARPGGCASIACAPAPVRRLPRSELLELEGTSDELDGIDEALAVHEALKQLPEHCAEILDRFFARDESYRAIGEALDIPPGTIASRISRCLRKLRGQLEGRNERFRPSDE